MARVYIRFFSEESQVPSQGPLPAWQPAALVGREASVNRGKSSFPGGCGAYSPSVAAGRSWEDLELVSGQVESAGEL